MDRSYKEAEEVALSSDILETTFQNCSLECASSDLNLALRPRSSQEFFFPIYSNHDDRQL
jgi:hypothetical protein